MGTGKLLVPPEPPQEPAMKPHLARSVWGAEDSMAPRLRTPLYAVHVRSPGPAAMMASQGAETTHSIGGPGHSAGAQTLAGRVHRHSQGGFIDAREVARRSTCPRTWRSLRHLFPTCPLPRLPPQQTPALNSLSPPRKLRSCRWFRPDGTCFSLLHRSTSRALWATSTQRPGKPPPSGEKLLALLPPRAPPRRPSAHPVQPRA